MRPRWHIPWMLVIACVALRAPAFAQVALPPAPDPAAVAKPPTWDQICKLTMDEGRIVLRCDLSLETLRTLQGEGQSIEGMPGTTWVTVGRMYQVRNVRREGDSEVTYTVLSTRTGLSLEVQRVTGQKRMGVSFYQTSAAYTQRGAASNTRVTIYGYGREEQYRSPEASDLTALRNEFPLETSRYLRPLLRDLGADLLAVAPAAARQVLYPTEEVVTESVNGTTRPSTRPIAVLPPVVAEVEQLVKVLDAPEFRHREAALNRLWRLGPPAVAVLQQMDRAKLSAQQNQSIDLLEAIVSPLPADQARKLQSDRNFLLDCLYVPDGSLRAAAAARLAELTNVSPARFKDVLANDPKKQVQRVDELVEGLRDELLK